MRSHADGHKDVPILQYMVNITHKGIDYDEGGLYVIDPSGTKIDVDAQMKPGSLLFFDGRLEHGVDTIGRAAGDGPGRVASFAIPTFFRTRRNLPRLLRRVEDRYWDIERRLAKLTGRPVRDEY